MKTIYQLFFLILLFAPISIFSQDVTYTFDAGGNGEYNTGTSTWTNLTVAGGTATTTNTPGVTFSDNGTTNASYVLKSTGTVSPNNGCIVSFDAIPSTTDQQVIFKEYLTSSTNAQTKAGFTLRASGSSTYGVGMKQGYFFRVSHNTGTVSAMGTVQFSIYKIDATSATGSVNSTAATIPGYTLGSALWVKATAIGSTLTMYYSLNGTTWTQAVTKTDATYASGGVQAYWGMGVAGLQPVYYDDVQYWDLTKNVSLSGSKFMFDGTAKTPTIAKTGFTSPVETITYTGINGTDYPASATAPSAIGTYLMNVSEVEGVTRTAAQVFTILPTTFDKIYTFEGDAIGTAAALTTTSTGANVTGGHTVQLFSGATEGGYSVSAKTLSITAGAANTRAISSLNDFGTTSTDYSVTWKEYNTTASANKHVVVLRADASTSNSFYSPSTNYRPQGQGYGFLVNPTGASAITLKIYKLNLLDTWTNITGATVSLTTFPVQGVPLWFRASVFGSSTVLLKFEYSTDGTNWVTATTAVDDSSPVASGATHLFGVNSNNQNYYFDYIGSKTITELTTSIGNTNTDKSKMFVTVNNKTIIVANASNFEVYNIQGMKVKEVRSNTTNHSLALSSGIYFIRSGNSTLKAIVK